MAGDTELVQPGEEVTDCCHQQPKRGYEEGWGRLLSEVHSRGLKDNSCKSRWDKFWLNTRKLFLKVRAAQPLNSCPDVKSPLMEMVRVLLEKPLSHLNGLCLAAVQGGILYQMISKEIPSDLNYSTVNNYILDIIFLKLQHTLKFLLNQHSFRHSLGVGMLFYQVSIIALAFKRKETHRIIKECKSRGYNSS